MATGVLASCGGEWKSLHNTSSLYHSVKEIERVDAACEDDGYVLYACSCGAEMHTTLEAFGHDYEEVSRSAATCISPEKVLSRCTRCEEEDTETIGEALGHTYDEDFTAALTVVNPCTREGCDYATLQEELFENSDSFLAEIKDAAQVSEETFALIEATYYRLQFIIEDVGEYDEDEHAYDAASDLVDINDRFEYYLGCLYQYHQDLKAASACAEVQKGIDIDDEKAQANYIKLNGLKENIYSQYCGFLIKAYESGLREYFYEGKTEEEIKRWMDFLDCNKADPEYVALQKRNAEIVTKMEILYSTLTDDGKDKIYATDDILDLYEEFVANNNRIAEILGGKDAEGEYVYSDGLYYSYAKKYHREYTPDDAVGIYENVLEYIVPLRAAYKQRCDQITKNEVPNWTNEQKALLKQLTVFCFTNATANAMVNDFLKEITYTYGGESVNYYDTWLDMANSGRFIRGELSAAYSEYLTSVDGPLVYIGNDCGQTTAFIHEFGHYADYCLKGDTNESYDLRETQSQGLELLYLSYLNANKSQQEGAEAVYEYYNLVEIYNYLGAIISQVSIDRFERAVYSNTYDGLGADVIMADGKITKDEYDTLYGYIAYELGMRENLGKDVYWRANADRFGYTISYSTSLLVSLQLYSAENFDANVAKYAKCINYYQSGDTKGYKYREVLAHAGLYSYDDEELFVYLSDLLALPNGEGAAA